MIHKTRVLIRTPGKHWAKRMATERRKIAEAAAITKPDGFDLHLIIIARLVPKPGEIVIKTLDGYTIDDGTGLEYEFVAYDRIRDKIIIAVFVGDSNVGAPIRFSGLFKKLKYGDAYEADRGFLIVKSTSSKLTEGWALQPTGKDSHSDDGFYVSPAYIDQLLKAAH